MIPMKCVYGDAPFRVVNTRDVKFSAVLSFPVRELQQQQRFERFNQLNPNMTESQYMD